MNLDQLEVLQVQINEELKITEDNLNDKILKFSTMYHRYAELYSKELRLLKRFSIDKDKKYGEVYNNLKFHSDYHLDSKAEIDTYVKADEGYCNISLQYQNQEVVVNYLEKVLDIVNKSSFTVKNFIDFYKLRNGI